MKAIDLETLTEAEGGHGSSLGCLGCGRTHKPEIMMAAYFAQPQRDWVFACPCGDEDALRVRLWDGVQL